MPKKKKRYVKKKTQAGDTSQNGPTLKEKPEQKSKSAEATDFEIVDYKPNPKDTAWKQTKKQLFIKYLPQYGTFSKTAQVVNLDRKTIEIWRKDDEDFDRAIAMCDVVITEQLERTGMYRAMNGSDNLLMFFLKSRDKRFVEKHVQQLDEATMDYMVSRFVSVVEKVAPKICPQCKTHMDIPNQIAKELLTLSQGMIKE